jgi:hypothetical protein
MPYPIGTLIADVWDSVNHLVKVGLQAPALTSVTVTIAAGQSESAAVDLGGRAIVEIRTPAAIEATTTRLWFKSGPTALTLLGRYQDAQKQTVTFAINQAVAVQPADFPALQFVSIVAETAAGVAVPQTADRVFTLVTRPV